MKDKKIILIALFLLILASVSYLIYKVDKSHAAEVNEENIMDIFPTEITNQKAKVTSIHFIKDTQSNIDTRYNEASIKADLTYNNIGNVKGWLEVDSEDNTKYILYVGSSGTIYLNTGEQLFAGFANVKNIDFANINTSKVTNMLSMFRDCHSLTSLDLSNFDTTNVTNMGAMFYNCNNLQSVDLHSFNTSNVTEVNAMFAYTNLTSLDLSNFDVSNIKYSTWMFYDVPLNNIKFNLINIDTNIIKITSDNLLVNELKENTINLITEVTRNNVVKTSEDKIVTNDKAIFNAKEYDVVVMGDTNGDGIINLTDIMRVAGYVYAQKELTGNYLKAADYNNDNKYGLTDIMQMAKKVYS